MTEELLAAIQRRGRESEMASHENLMATISPADVTAAADDDAGGEPAQSFSAFAVRAKLNIDEMNADQLRAAIGLYENLNAGKKRVSASSDRDEILNLQYHQEMTKEVIRLAREDVLASRGNVQAPDYHENLMRTLRGAAQS